MHCNQMSPMSTSSTSTTSSSLAVRSPPTSARYLSRLTSSFRRRNPVTGEGCISKDMMVWGGGAGAKKLMGCEPNEEAVSVKGYQRPRKIASSRKGIRKMEGHPVLIYNLIQVALDFVFIFFADFMKCPFICSHLFCTLAMNITLIRVAYFAESNGNPITGEGFKPEINTTVPSLNGTNQVINRNRIPPGGFSSGLW